MVGKISRMFKGYPKWFHLVPEFPSEEQFRESFKRVFKFYPEECQIIKGHNEMQFAVSTPKETCSHGGIMCEYTETPVTFFKHEYYFGGAGCTWSIDENGKRFHLLDKKTGDISRKQEALDQRTIRNYLVNAKQIKRDININKVLGDE